MNQFQIPIVLICFKRIDTTLQILKRIAAVKPQKLYILSDAGKNEQEKQTVDSLRNQIESRIDWPCDVVKNYAQENRGVFENIGMGARWVFGREERAIFLEDDNLPEVSFFRFCWEMLERYCDDQRVLWVCGTNYNGKNIPADGSSYMFTRNLLPCGWASWSDKFLKHYDYQLKGLDDPSVVMNACKSYLNYALFKQQIFNVRGEKNRMDNGKRCLSWDSQMAFSIRTSGMFGIFPSCNQIKNIGVDEFSVHGGNNFCFEMTKRFCSMESYPLEFPLIHPQEVRVDPIYEDKLEKTILFPLFLRIKGVIVRSIKRFLQINIYEPLNLKDRIRVKLLKARD